MSTNSTIATSKKVTITLPSLNLGVLVKKITDFVSELLLNVYNPIANGSSNSSQAGSSRRGIKMPNMKNFKFDKKSLKVILPVILGVLVLLSIVKLVGSLPNAKSQPESTTQTVNAPDSVATINLDKKFAFPLKDENGKTAGTFDYVIQSANLQKQIIVQGQRASAVSGRIFLVLNLKITNNLKQTIQLNTRDYLRLVVSSNNKEQLAPDIHNDPVEVQAISTKYTRVGIAIDEKDAKNLVQLKVGEIDGKKENIDLKFDY